MSIFFQFEADFVDSLRCIPMIVRLKLDTCGVKLKLSHWFDLEQKEKQQLIELPCTSQAEINAYKNFLQNAIAKKTGAPAGEFPIDNHPAWLDIYTIPIEVENKAEEVGVKITLSQWQNLSPLQRFALIKLSRSNHENKNFYPALHEFNLT